MSLMTASVFVLIILFSLYVATWIITAVVILVDIRKYDDDDWRASGESRAVWLLLSTLLLFPFGVATYLVIVREKLDVNHKEKVKQELLETLRSEESDRRKLETASQNEPQKDAGNNSEESSDDEIEPAENSVEPIEENA